MKVRSTRVALSMTVRLGSHTPWTRNDSWAATSLQLGCDVRPDNVYPAFAGASLQCQLDTHAQVKTVYTTEARSG